MLLYKYLCPSRRCILHQRLIRFTPPGSFSDPFDSLPYFEENDPAQVEMLMNKVGNQVEALSSANLTGRVLTDFERKTFAEAMRLAKDELIRKHLANRSDLPSRQLNDSLRPRMNSTVGILCLCASNQSIVMWSHYASGHTGFLLGFDSENEFFQHRPGEQDDIGKLRIVTYSPKRVSDKDPEPDFFFTKNDEWTYEREWRILRFLKDADKTPAENIHLFAIPPSAIREVIFGCFAPPDLIADLVLAKQANPDLSHVRFYRAKLSPNRFQMDIMPYEP